MRNAGVVTLSSKPDNDDEKPIEKLVQKWKKYAQQVHNFAGFRKAARSFTALPPTADPRMAAKMLCKMAAKLAVKYRSPELRRLAAELREASNDVHKSKKLLDNITANPTTDTPQLQRPAPRQPTATPQSDREAVNLVGLAKNFIILNLKRNNPRPTQKQNYTSSEMQKAFNQYLEAKGYNVPPDKSYNAWQQATQAVTAGAKNRQDYAERLFFGGPDNESLDLIISAPNTDNRFARMIRTATEMDGHTNKLNHETALKVIGAAVEHYAAIKNPSKITEEDFRAFLREEYPVLAEDPHFGYLWKGLYAMTHRPARHDEETKKKKSNRHVPKRANPMTPMRATLSKLSDIVRQYDKTGHGFVPYQKIQNILSPKEFQIATGYGLMKIGPDRRSIWVNQSYLNRRASMPVSTVVPLAKWLVSKVDELTGVRALNWAKMLFRWIKNPSDPKGERLINQLAERLDSDPKELRHEIMQVVNPAANPTTPTGGVGPQQPPPQHDLIKATYRGLQASAAIRGIRVSSPKDLWDKAVKISTMLSDPGSKSASTYAMAVREMINPSKGFGRLATASPRLLGQYASVLVAHQIPLQEAKRIVREAAGQYILSTGDIDANPFETDFMPTGNDEGPARVGFAGAVIGCGCDHHHDTQPTWNAEHEGIRFGEELDLPHDGAEHDVIPDEKDTNMPRIGNPTNNPWAICTDSVGRSDKKKYERCIHDVKREH